VFLTLALGSSVNWRAFDSVDNKRQVKNSDL